MKLHKSIFAGIAVCISMGISAETKVLQQGLDGYNGVEDTQLCDASMVMAHADYEFASHNEGYEIIHLHRC